MARKNLLKGFKRPKGISFEHVSTNPNYGKFTAYPFETGFGTTVGNTLRRVLLSSIQGYAITSIRITSYDENGISHVISSEFEAIPNVAEDTLEIINTLKMMRVRLPDDEEQNTIQFEFKGPGVVKSDDFAKEGQLEVMTKDKVVFTMMEGAHLDIEIQVDLGRGYVPAETNEHYIEVVGTITPDNALSEAAKIAKEHFAVFINFNDKDEIGTDDSDEGDESIINWLNTPVEELELSVRSSNCLKNANIRTLGELTKKTEDDITKTRNFGKKSLQEIKEKLQEWNLTLGMTDYSHLKNAANLTKQKEEKDES